MIAHQLFSLFQWNHLVIFLGLDDQSRGGVTIDHDLGRDTELKTNICPRAARAQVCGHERGTR